MLFRRLAVAALFAGSLSSFVMAQSSSDPQPKLFLELNAVQDVEGSCRLSFLVTNETGQSIDNAKFETVIFDADGGVVSLSVFNFRDLPENRPRVRQFTLAERSCNSVGRALINGVSSCTVAGAESDICHNALVLSSRLDMELLG